MTSVSEKLSVVDHVAVSVNDIVKAVEWYRANFHCEIEYQDATWAMLKFANTRLALVIPEQHPPHVCFLDADADRFGTLKTHRDGTRTIYVPDSSGNAVEVMDAACRN
jgi:catechol 2,3-dioxygenase-like lactoylglutathione lyase family enzyme